MVTIAVTPGRRPLPWRIEVEVALQRFLDERRIRQIRADLRAEQREKHAALLADVAAALDVLERETTDPSGLIGYLPDQRRAVEALRVLTAIWRPTLDTYRPPPATRTKGPGKPPHTFLAACRAIVAAKRASYDDVAAYLVDRRPTWALRLDRHEKTALGLFAPNKRTAASVRAWLHR